LAILQLVQLIMIISAFYLRLTDRVPRAAQDEMIHCCLSSATQCNAYDRIQSRQRVQCPYSVQYPSGVCGQDGDVIYGSTFTKFGT